MKVAVVGTGLSGLRSAMLLEASGHEVALFEARDRAGGRIHTSPSGFEEGAEWVDEDHERLRSLMRHFGIREVPAQPGEYALQFRGIRATESHPWNGAGEDLARFESGADSIGGGPTIGDLIDATCRTPEGRWLAAANIRTDEGDEPSRLGLQPWRDFRKLYTLREGREASAYRFEGGGSRFVQTILGSLRATPIFDARLLSVVESSAGVELSFAGSETTADAAVIALPLPCLRDVRFDPPLLISGEISKLGFADAVKARFHFPEPFWLAESWFGYMKSDLLVQQTWPDREDPNALIGYIVGDAARALLGDPSPEQTLTAEWLRWSAKAATSGVEVKNWSADPFARGAFSIAPPGSNPAAVRERRDGRVQVVGEFCASWLGFMEGALESAETGVAALS